MRAYNLIQVILLALVFSSSVYAQSAVEKKSTGKQSTLKVTKKPDKNQSQNPLDNKASSSSDKSSDDQSKTEKVEQPKNEVDSAIVEEKTEQSSQQKPNNHPSKNRLPQKTKLAIVLMNQTLSKHSKQNRRSSEPVPRVDLTIEIVGLPLKKALGHLDYLIH